MNRLVAEEGDKEWRIYIKFILPDKKDIEHLLINYMSNFYIFYKSL